MKRVPALLLLAGCAGGSGSLTVWEAQERGFAATEAPLRAGAVDDNRRFDDYVRYFKAYPERDVRKVDITDRTVLTFVNLEDRPVSFALVRILAEGDEIYRAVTDAGGQLMFPPRAVVMSRHVRSFHAEVDGCRVRFDRGRDQTLRVDVPQPWRRRIDVDVAFCLDTTGSMSDEIDRIKRTLRDVAARLDRLSPRPRFRWGMVAYRDRGDDYVTRVTPFTSRLDVFMERLGRVRAAGGGNYEEAVNEALDCAVTGLDWNTGDAIRLLFLIGDAPPHAERRPNYTRSMRRALEMGIKIPTIAASGLNDKGEFIWRQLAQFTLAPFMFISYGGTTRHHVGGYRENNLDVLMARVVTEQIRKLGRSVHLPVRVTGGRGRAPDEFYEYRGQD